ncbi:hypothetical protein OS493_022897 [Desmophyllum pertusum]|uniref:Uncharacterized protein n=1 Tax=Desmophyllum pertusum TaxID=174260 RepID=A0A9W9ZMX9_9CNID|nr:hypothetical protein OS493_022897 [Desmophyllum pertusum]
MAAAHARRVVRRFQIREVKPQMFLSNTSEQSRHVSYQRGASHAQYQTEPHISSTPLHVNARENAPTTYDQRQTAYGGMRMPRRQLSNQTNAGPRAESSRYIPQRPQFTSWPQRAQGQQRFPSQARANRHQDIANDPTAQLQNSTAVPINVHNVHSPPRAPNTLSRSWSNQQLIVNQDLAARNQTNNDAMNIHSQQRYTNTAVQGAYNEHNTVSSDRQRYLNKETIDVDRRRGLAESSSVSAATHENRIAQRSELMKYIANQLASREGPAPSATNSSDFMNSASRRHEPGRPGQAYNENAAANEWLNRTASTSRCQEMAGRRQRQDTGAYAEGQCTSSRNVFSVGNNLGARDVGQRYHSNQRVRQDNVHSQPRYDAMHRNVNPLQGGLQSNGETERNDTGLSSSRQKETLGTRLVESSPRETTMRRNSPVQASPTVASATPVISQISYGVIRRSTHGENVSPKRTATALVIDQQRSIYVDATDSVIDEERSPGTTGQQFSNGGNKFPHTNQPGSVAVSCPVSSGAAVRGWLQETERPVNSNLTSGQQQHIQCSSVSQQSPSTFSAGYLSLANQTSQPRLYSTEMPPRKTAPKIDKRCVANNTLPVYTNHLPLKRSSVPTFISGQQSCIVEAPVRSIAEIAKPCEVPKPCVVAKPCEVATSHGLARPCEVSKPYEVARLCEAVKPCEVAKPQVATKLCDHDNTETDDIVEIIDPPPKRSSIPNTTRDSEKKDKDMPLISGQQSCIDETCAPAAKSTAELSKTYHADRPDKTDESDDVVEITNPSLKRDSVDHENVEKKTT